MFSKTIQKGTRAVIICANTPESIGLAMRPIWLQTADCEDVAQVYIPPFADDKLPEVVFWGERVFAIGRFNDGRKGCRIGLPGQEMMPVYRECFAVSAVVFEGE
jgi:hypothetical protein